MKRKKPKTKASDNWREIKIRLPKDFVRGLSSLRDKKGNVLPLPFARGNAILDRLSYALDVANELAGKLELRHEQLSRALYLLKKYEDRMTEKGVEYVDILEKEKVRNEGRLDEPDGDDQSDPGDTCED
jgi:hypothetical protein